MSVIKARTARIPHLCDNCHWSPSLRGVATIAPGHRYLLHTAYPGDEWTECTVPYSIKECVACAADLRDHLTGACLSWCCGDVPCARPERHDGDHSCRRCAVEGRELTTASRSVAAARRLLGLDGTT